MKQPLLKLLSIITLSIFSGEFFTMIFIRGHIGADYSVMVAVVDASILTCVVFPFLYFFHYKPLRNSFDRIKQFENSLIESEDKFKKIFNNSPLGISLLSRDWKYLDINPAMERIVGFSREELISKTPRAITHPDFIEKNTRAFNALLAGECSCYSFEKKYIRKDGKEIWCKLSASRYCLKDTEAAPYLIAIMEDITARKTVENKLKRSQAMLSEAEKLANIGHWQWNPHSENETWSDQMFRIMGFEPGYAIPEENELKTVYSEKDWRRVADCRERVFKTGIAETVKVSLRDRGAGKEHLLVNIRQEPDTSGKKAGLFGTCQDITAIKSTEEKLRKAKEEAEEATRLKDKFVSLVAHDLRGPSTSNTNLIQHILQDKNNPVQMKHREILNLVLLSSQKMNMLVKDVLNISRLKTGSLRLNKKHIKARELVDDTLNNLMVQIKSKEMNFVNKVPKETVIFADTPLLGQVVENILTNALKFSYKGGTVEIFQPEADDCETSIAISDRGTGMPSETLRYIFNYEKGASTEGTAGEIGTGLGLPLSKDIISAHGGRLEVKTKTGEGSVFYIKMGSYRQPG